MSEPRTQAPNGWPASEQPDWRQEFPIDVPEDNYVARRDFTRFLGLTSLAFVVGQFWIVAQNWLRARRGAPDATAIARLDELAIGAVKEFTYPEDSDACLLVRLDANNLVAYSQQCTHLSCAVVPEVARGCLHCPCHHGYFELSSGRPIAGPPRRPLNRIRLEVRDDVVYAVGVEARTI